MRYQRVKFCDVYYLADSIWKAVISPSDELILETFLNPVGDGFSSIIATPSRYTTLHYFINGYYNYLLDEFERKAEVDTVIDEYEFILKSYGIEIMEESDKEIVVDEYGWCEEDECHYHIHNDRYYPFYNDHDEIYDILRSFMPIDDIVN